MQLAFRLMSLAAKINDTLPRLRSDLDKLAREKTLPPKPRFFLRCYVDINSPDWDGKQIDPAEYERWCDGFRHNIIGSMMNQLDGNWRVGARNLSEAKMFIEHDGFTVIEVESMEEAQRISRRCPLLKIGGVVEVSEVSESVP